MNITTANTYDIAQAVLKEHGFEPHKVIVNRGNGYTHEMILQARDESEVGSFMRNHWGGTLIIQLKKLFNIKFL